MKNIHLLPTDKPSRLCFRNYLFINKDNIGTYSNVEFKNIYITNSEEIKEGDWYYWTVTNSVQKAKKDNLKRLPKISDGSHKIILTTDQDLIKDGVQAIDDEFLEWFVKNPSCEDVEVEKQMLCDYCGQEHCDNLRCRGYKDSVWYEIIIPREEPKHIIQKVATHLGKTIPETLKHIENFSKELDKLKEEPKQETLEEDVEIELGKLAIQNSKKFASKSEVDYTLGFIQGAKLQAEKMYSEKEVLDLLQNFNQNALEYIKEDEKSIMTSVSLKKWFKQYKKKQPIFR